MRNAFLFRRRTLALASVATALAVGAVGAAVAAATSSTPAGGSIRVFSTSPGTGGGGKILITGAIGDHGTVSSVNKAGKPASNSNYKKFALAQGTIEANITKINAKANQAYASAQINRSTCSAAIVFSGPATLLDGTGLYAGITGTVNITVSVGILFPRYASGAHQGQCNENANPTASTQLVEGTGTVSFS